MIGCYYVNTPVNLCLNWVFDNKFHDIASTLSIKISTQVFRNQIMGTRNHVFFPKPNMIYIAFKLPPKKKPASNGPNIGDSSKTKNHMKQSCIYSNKLKQMDEHLCKPYTGKEPWSRAENSALKRQVVESRDWSALTTSVIDGRFSGITDVHLRAISRAPSISWWEEFGIFGSRTWKAPLEMLIFRRTHFKTSRESAPDSVCSAGRPVTSSKSTTPKLYTSICSVGFLQYSYSGIKKHRQRASIQTQALV